MISTDALRAGFLSPHLFVNEGLSFTIVNEGSSLTIFNQGTLLTIVNETASFIKTIILQNDGF